MTGVEGQSVLEGWPLRKVTTHRKLSPLFSKAAVVILYKISSGIYIFTRYLESRKKYLERKVLSASTSSSCEHRKVRAARCAACV
jgi:hypothetical protein